MKNALQYLFIAAAISTSAFAQPIPTTLQNNSLTCPWSTGTSPTMPPKLKGQSLSESAINLIPSSIVYYGPSALMAVRNAAEIFTHSHELHHSYKVGTLLKDFDNVYHGIELSGHSGNLANYVEVPSAWYGYLSLVAFNVYAATSQYRTITRNMTPRVEGARPLPISLTSKVIVAFGSVDLIGHVIDGTYALGKFFGSLVKTD